MVQCHAGANDLSSNGLMVLGCMSNYVISERCEHLHDDTTHNFCDLWHYGVAKSSQSVHPSGNPMSHSTHIGFNDPLVT